MRTLLVLVLVALLASPVALAQSRTDHEDQDTERPDADPTPRSATPEERRGENGRPSNDDDEEDDDKKERAKERKSPEFGAFKVAASARSVAGDYVSFNYTPGSIENFTVAGVVLFNLTTPPAEAAGHASTVTHGSEVRVETPAYSLRTHDNPSVPTRIESDGPMRLSFLPGTSLERIDGKRVEFRVGGVTGTMRGDHITLEGSTLVARGDVLFVVDAPRGEFDVHREDIGKAIGKGHVGAEMSLRLDNTSKPLTESVSYGNVTLTTLKAEPGNLTVLIDGSGFDGRVLVFNVDGRVVGASAADHLRVLFDNASIARASTLADVLDPDDDGLAAEHYLVFDPISETFQLIVSVPHYSVHVLTLGTIVLPLKPTVVFGVIAGIALLAPTALLLFRRK